MSKEVYINIDELQGSKWSIEEVGEEDYIPEKKNEAAEKEETHGSHYLVSFTDVKTLQKLKQKYRVYIINASTEEDFAKVLHNLIQLEKRLHNGVQVSFVNVSDHDNDHYRIIIKCDQCAHCKFSIKVDETKCLCQLDSEDFLPIEQLLASECKNCGSSPDMRLNSQGSFNSCFEFQLTCNNTSLRTPTNAKIGIRTLDSNGEIVWKDERSFAVCFHNMDGVSTDQQILRENHENILAKMKGEIQVIENLIQRKVLSNDFQVDNLARKDLIGKLLRHLLNSDNGLPQFIDALNATELPQNLELAYILFKDFKNS